MEGERVGVLPIESAPILLVFEFSINGIREDVLLSD